MPEDLYFANVILPVPVPDLFTYKLSSGQVTLIKKGCRVIVQFGKRKIYTAIVDNIHKNRPSDHETKEIISVLDEKPVVNEIQLSFWKWIADYYMCTVGEVYKAALPSGLKLESETKIFTGQEYDVAGLSEQEQLICNMLTDNQEMTIREVSLATGRNDVSKILKSLIDKKIVFAEEKLKEGYRPKVAFYVQLHKLFHKEKELNSLVESLEKAPNQLSLILAYVTISGFPDKKPFEVERSVLIKKANSNYASFNALIKKGIFTVYEKEIGRIQTDSEKSSEPVQLNVYQNKAYDSIQSLFKKNEVILLHGITSSGKTEIYIHLINEQIKKGKQVLYLLPEIALTEQIINRLKRVFGDIIGVYHSKFSDSERVEVWQNLCGEIRDGQCRYQIILGVRSSVFLPFEDLGLIIVDEEHENTYKQFDPAPRYNARDAAIILALMHKAKVLLGTATPSIESYFNARSGKYGFVELNERYLDKKLPEIKVVNTKELKKQKRMKSLFSPILLDHITRALKNGEQVILFQNRRGFSPYLTCDVCGWIPQCKNCDVSLTYHKYFNSLICHYCGYSIHVPHKCEKCAGTDLQTRGFGTEKIEDEVKIFFPQAKVVRMDLDTTRSKRSYKKIISGFEDRKTDILIGTQIISKGLDFDNVRMVGILNADDMLNFPDFRSFERSFQLMSQVAGRAGRKKDRGLVIIQTTDHTHPVIQHVVNNNYKAMFSEQIVDRKNFRYPPYFKLTEITLKHKDKQVLGKAASFLADHLKQKLGDRILGPEYPLISRIQNYYLKNILVKIERDKQLSDIKKFIHLEILRLNTQKNYKSVQVTVDVDVM